MSKLFVSVIIVSSLFGAVFGQRTTQSTSRIFLSEPVSFSYLGVTTVEVTKENFSKYNLREVRGVAVERVAKDSPAERAGIQKGDVIVRFGDEEVSSVFKLTRLLNETAPDHTAKITVLRGGGEIELTATLGRREIPQFQGGVFNSDDFSFPNLREFPRVPATPNGAQILPFPRADGDGNVFIYRGGAPSRQIGVSATALTKQLGDYFGVPSGEGVLISTVRENSPAAKAGLKAGDIIVEADGNPVKNNADLVRALSEKKEGDVTLTVVRDKNRQSVRVAPEASKGAAFQYFGDESDERQKRLRQLMPPSTPGTPNQK